MSVDTVIRRRDVPALAKTLHADPLAHGILAARGVIDADELAFALADLPGPDSLPDIDVAVERLLLARQRQQRVLIVGDYDCDGATSTTVAVLGLRAFGFMHVDYLVPNRFTDGYGLSVAIVQSAQVQFEPDLIVTVDNGVASIDGVAAAREAGIDVLVTDHHLPPDELPAAIAIVNPTRVGARFPGRHLAGVGVIFYVLLALRSALAKAGEPGAGIKLAELLDLVAIGTIADVVPLDRVNRTLVEQGLRRIRAGHTRPGVLALLACAGRDASRLVSSDIGFALGPRLNAAGRLDDMRRGIQCLLAEDTAEAARLAGELDQLNVERRQVERGMRADAEAALNKVEAKVGRSDAAFGVCLYDADWHQGVIGIVAGRLKERLHRPVIVFTAGSDEIAKGSARSVPGVHVRDVLQDIATAYPGLIVAFGGHAMAAGLSLERARLDEFADAFDATVCHALDGRLPAREWQTDGALDIMTRSLVTARMLRDLMPWGQGCEEPSFDGEFQVRSSREVGNGHLKLTLSGIDVNQEVEAGIIDAIAFNEARMFAVGDRLRLVYGLEVNRWRDAETVQMNIRHLEALAGE